MLEDRLSNSLDKNKIPMASLRNSMNLEQTHRGLATDGKTFVFVVQNVPLHLVSEDI